MGAAAQLERSIVLLVDDDPRIIECLVEDLRPMGVEFLAAHSVAEARAHLDARPVNAIVCDVAMPGGSGMQLLQDVRARGLQTPFYFLTGYDTPENLQMALRIGATDFVQKPYEPDHLTDLLWRGLEIDRRQRRIDDAIAAMAFVAPNGRELTGEIDRNRQCVGIYRILGHYQASPRRNLRRAGAPRRAKP